MMPVLTQPRRGTRTATLLGSLPVWGCLLLCLGFLRATALGASVPSGPVPRDFASPPPAARPWVYWYFMDGNMSAEGMTADLEAMRDAGIGGAIVLEVDIGVPRGPVRFMSPGWRRLIVHAVREAERVGIEIALGSGPGWCGTGGPWVKPEQSMQHLVASETNLVGPIRFEGLLERPKPRTPFFGEGTLTPELAKAWREYYRDVAVVAFPTPKGNRRLENLDGKALYQRAPYSSQPGVKSALPMSADPPVVPSEECVSRDGVVDLTSRMTPDGRLGWDVPAGTWTVQRFVRTATGQTTRPAPLPGLGFESDKFDPAAVDDHLAHFVDVILKDLGPRRAGTGGLTTLHFDSWEMSAQNWSGTFREQFRERRGYDPLTYLPAFTGRLVGSLERTERFLWDVRQTAQELVIAHHVTRLRDTAHRNGLRFSSEPYDMNPCADLSLGAVADVPMGEFWWLGFNTFHTVIEAASIAHTQGREIVAAESFTSDAGEDWRAHPGNLKAMGDWAFGAGVNRIAFHRYQHQPWLDREPGMRMGIYGVHWERTQTWWSMASAYHTYLARCQYLLRQGRAVADILYLAAEGAPHVFRAPASATFGHPPDRREYNFDGCAPETLMQGARVEQGRIVFPGGTAYRVLVLPNEATMTPGLLRKIEQLVDAGARVVGPPPRKSPGLSGYPGCDAEVQELAAVLWATNRVKGRVIWGPEFATVAAAVPTGTAVPKGPDVSTTYADFGVVARYMDRDGWPPDFESTGPIRYTHRATDDADLYFVSNRSDARVEATCRFRVTGRRPALWHPVTGARLGLRAGEVAAGTTAIRLVFEPLESYFVVFQAGDGVGEGGIENFQATREIARMLGAWEVGFQDGRGAPERAVFGTLSDWSRHEQPGIRFYSGRATYRKTLNLAADVVGGGAAERRWLDLGDVRNLATVRVNGRELGTVWCAPWRVEVTGMLQAGANDVEITVANLWPNRLIGDAGLPPDQRHTWTTSNPYKAGAPLLPSGLLGPVTLRAR